MNKSVRVHVETEGTGGVEGDGGVGSIGAGYPDNTNKVYSKG